LQTKSDYYKMRATSIFIFLISIVNISFAQNAGDTSDYYHDNYLRYENYVYVNNIKTVTLEKYGLQLSDPVIGLNSGDQLVLTFDDLDGDVKNYSYTFIHCNADWTPSQVIISQYLHSFFDAPLTDYQYAFNTLQTYTHYKLIFPNENLSPALSGNYLLKIFLTEYPDSVILTRRWMQFDSKVQIDANVKRATVIEDRYSKQEIDFSVAYSTNFIQNPFSDIKITIMQNSRWDNTITNLKPLYLKDNLLDYNFDEENVFNGGNEFRNFDTRSLRFQTQFVKKIIEDSTGYHVYVTNDESRSALVYSIWDDINGRFVNTIYDDRDGEIEGQYAYVHFKLLYPDPIQKGTPYIFGELTDWRLIKEGKLKYNYDQQAYETELYLKQGYYNYEYVVVSDGSDKIDETIIEGNHFETENNYAIFVYHRPVGGRYDQLIGWKKLNSSHIY
jgi:type 9 secretion system plug protein